MGQNYLVENYNDPQDVIKHIYEGSIVGVATGTPGRFHITVYLDVYPDLDELDPQYALKLCLHVTDQAVYFRDLYALLRWEKERENDCRVNMENGFYEIIVCSWMPASGIRGRDQQIHMYFNKAESLPQLHYEGVPALL